MRLDRQLEAGGHLPLTSYWAGVDQLQRFYAHPTADMLLACIGRGGCKSHTSTKIGLNETLCGTWNVPAGERHFFAYVSVSKDEASQRIRLIESYLRVLGVPFTTEGDTIRLTDLPLGFKVFAATIAAVSGFRCIGYVIDEACKHQIKGKSPLEELVASLNAMCVTHTANRPKKILISSPMGKSDWFYLRWVAGNSEHTVCLHAATWEANPSISYEATLLAEPDPRYHSREYGAIARDDIEESSFFLGALDNSIDVGRIGPPPYCAGRIYTAAIDSASTARGDRWGYAIVTSEPGALDPVTAERNQRRVTTVHESDSWVPDEQTPSNLLRRFKREILSRYDNPTRVIADQDSFSALRELARGVGLSLVKIERFRTVRMAMLEGTLRLPDSPALIAEFRSITSVITETGQESIRQPRTPHRGHCDAATAAVLGCSEAMLKPPHLPAGRMTRLEQLERKRSHQLLGSIFGWAPAPAMENAGRQNDLALLLRAEAPELSARRANEVAYLLMSPSAEVYIGNKVYREPERRRALRLAFLEPTTRAPALEEIRKLAA
jgi:hypothetical protein